MMVGMMGKVVALRSGIYLHWVIPAALGIRGISEVLAASVRYAVACCISIGPTISL